MKLAHQFKRIRLNLARSKTFPAGSALHGYEFVAPWTRTVISTRSYGKNNESIAAFGGSGMETTNRSAGWCTSQVAPSTPGGYSTTTLREATMMSPDIDSAAMPSARANTYRSHTTSDLHTFKVMSVEPAV